MPFRMKGILNFFLQPLDVGPGEARLEMVGRRAAPRRRLVALGEVALAAAVVVEVDGEAERDVAVGDGALDMVVDPARVAAHVELEDLGMVVAAATASRPGEHAELSMCSAP